MIISKRAETALDALMITVILYLLVLIISLIAMFYNYFVGLGVFLFGLIIVTAFRFRDPYIRLIAWTIYSYILITSIVASYVQPRLTRRLVLMEPDILIELLGPFGASIVLAILIGMFVSLIIHSLFLFPRFYLRVEKGEIVGRPKSISRLLNHGGPGLLRVHPEQAVVLQRHGVFTKMVTDDLAYLWPTEKVKAIVPFGGKSDATQISNLMTRDRIALELDFAYGARVETVQETQDRLNDLFSNRDKLVQDIENARIENDQILAQNIEDVDTLRDQQQQARATLQETEIAVRELRKEHAELTEERRKKFASLSLDRLNNEYFINQLTNIISNSAQIVYEGRAFYEDIIQFVASTAPDLSGATKGAIEDMLRDIFISNDFDEYFMTDLEADDLQTKIDERTIDRIEKYIRNKVNESKRNDAIFLNFIDISKIHFPHQIKNKLKKVSEARLDEQAAQYEARATVIRARAKAQKKVLEGQSEGEARAAFFRMLLHELKQEESIQDDALAKTMLELINRMFSATDLDPFAKGSPMGVLGGLTIGVSGNNGAHKNTKSS